MTITRKKIIPVALSLAFLATPIAWAQVSPLAAGTNAAATTMINTAANTGNTTSTFGRPVFMNPSDLANAYGYGSNSGTAVPLPRATPGATANNTNSKIEADLNAALKNGEADPKADASKAEAPKVDGQDSKGAPDASIAANPNVPALPTLPSSGAKTTVKATSKPTLTVYNGRPESTPRPEMQWGYDTFNRQEAQWGQQEQKFSEQYAALSRPVSPLGALAKGDIELRMAIEKAQFHGQPDSKIKEQLSGLSSDGFKAWVIQVTPK